MEKFRGVPMVLRSLANSTGMASRFPVARLTAPTRTACRMPETKRTVPNTSPRSRTSAFTTVCRASNALQLCTPSSSIKWLTPSMINLQIRRHSSGTGGPVHGSEGSPSELDKVAADDCNQLTVPYIGSFSSERVNPVPAPQGSSIAVSDALEKTRMDESNEFTVLNDFDWHAHIAMGSFLYKGQVLTIKATSFQDYSQKNPMLETRQIYGDPSGKHKSFVKDEGKVHTWKLINSLSEFHRIGLCVVDLDHTKILICDGVAKFAPDVSFVPATDALKQENFVKLEEAIRCTLFQGKPLPYHMKHLLRIMRTDAVEAIALLKCHVALVRQVHKTAFFMRMYDFVHCLRLSNDQIWHYLLSYLPYKYTWLKIMLSNELLYACLVRYPEGSQPDPQNNNNNNKSDPQVVLFNLLRKLKMKRSSQDKFVQNYRSLRIHKMDDSIDSVTGEILYTEQMFEDILESELPMLEVELQYRLYKMGKLEIAQLDSFFGLGV